ncbi:PAS domain-containing protein [Rhizobium sp.]
MQHKTTETVFNYFNALRAERSAPLRSEIDPAALKNVLPDIFILEKKRDGIVRFRLAGTRICLILGRELREHAFTEIWDEPVSHRMRLAADTVLANRSALEVAVTAFDDEGETMPLEMLMLPLFSNEDHCDRIFGSLVTLDNIIPAEGVIRRLAPADIVFKQVETEGRVRPLAGAATGNVIKGSFGGLSGRATHLRVFEGGRRD